MRLLKKQFSHCQIPQSHSKTGRHRLQQQWIIDNSFHFMYFFAVHPRIFYLFTKVNYANFHVSLCFIISYKDRKIIDIYNR